jgi:MFS family permease
MEHSCSIKFNASGVLRLQLQKERVRLIKAKKNNILRKTLRISIIEGIFSQIYGTFAMIGSSFIVKLLVILNASPIQFSLLSSIGQVSQIFQPLGVAITHNLPWRKRTCIKITAIGRFLTFFLGISLLFTVPQTGIWFILILLFCSASLLSIGGNIWIAWISDIVPLSYRGRFFSKRNQFLLVAGLLAGYLGSFAVDLFDANRHGFNQTFINFTGWGNFFRPEKQGVFLTGIFVFATFLSLIGLAVLSRQPEKKTIIKEEPLLEQYKQPLKDANFRKLLFFGVWWMLAIGIGSAFWSPFMLTKLKMSLFEVQLYGSLHIVSSLLSYRFWGRFIDTYGNKSAMFICVLLGGLNPMFWLFMTAQNHYIIWFEALISGFMWAGTGIVSTNFVLSIAPKGRAQVYSGLYGAFGGVGMMCTTLLSGILFPASLNLLYLHLEPEQVIFGIGGLVRWTALIPLFIVVEAKSKSLRNLSLLFWENISNRIKIFKQ